MRNEFHLVVQNKAAKDIAYSIGRIRTKSPFNATCNHQGYQASYLALTVLKGQ